MKRLFLIPLATLMLAGLYSEMYVEAADEARLAKCGMWADWPLCTGLCIRRPAA